MNIKEFIQTVNSIPYCSKILLIYFIYFLLILLYFFKKEGVIAMIKELYNIIKYIWESIFKNVFSFLMFELIIATLLYFGLAILNIETGDGSQFFSCFPLAFAFSSFAVSLHESDKSSKEIEKLNEKIDDLIASQNDKNKKTRKNGEYKK